MEKIRDMKPTPCDRVIDLIIDGEIWKQVKLCDMHVEKAVREVQQEAQRRAWQDGKEHSHAIHLKGAISVSPTQD